MSESEDIHDNLANRSSSYEESGCVDFFWRTAVCLAVLVAISLPGNALTIFIFLRQKLTPPTLQFLVLAILDFLLMLLSLFITVLPHFILYSAVYSDIGIFLTAYGAPVLIIIYCMTTWLVVLMAWNRYLAITKPLHYHRITSLKYVIIQILILLVLCVIFTIPRFLEMEIHRIDPPFLGRHFYSTVTNLHQNKHYQLYYRAVSYLILLAVLPLAMLIYFTYKLIQEIKLSNARRSELFQGSQYAASQASIDDHRITIVLTAVVVVFIIFHTPVLIYRIMELYFILKYESADCMVLDLTVFGTSRIMNMFVQVNATFNFVIYIILSPPFRKDLINLCCCCCSYIRKRTAPRTNSDAVSNTTQEENDSCGSRRSAEQTKFNNPAFAGDQLSNNEV